MSLIPRKYQKNAVNAITSGIKKYNGPLLGIIPTGGGKSLIIAMLIARLPDIRIVIITPRIKLLQQNKKYLSAGIGVMSGALGNDSSHKIIIGTYQTLIRREIKGSVDMIIIDEAHLLPNENDLSEYAAFLSRYPAAKIIGLTATASRSGRSIHRGTKAMWTCVYQIPITHLIAKGYLVPPIPFKTRGKSIHDDMGEAIGDNQITDSILPTALDKLFEIGCKRTLIFSKNISHVNYIVGKIKAWANKDYLILPVHSKMPSKLIAASFNQFENYEDDRKIILVNCSMCITGVDLPIIDSLILLRRFSHMSTYIQVVGRGIRANTNKTHCAVLDYGSNSKRFGSIDEAELSFIPDDERTLTNKTGIAQKKYCAVCDAENSIASKLCIFCKNPFIPKAALKEIADDSPLLSIQYRHGIVRQVTHQKQPNGIYKTTVEFENDDLAYAFSRTKKEFETQLIYRLESGIGVII